MEKKTEYGKDVLQRLRQVRDRSGLTQKEFGERIHLKRTSYSSIEQGHNSLTEKHINLVAEKFNIRREWLLYGTGSMHPAPEYETGEVNEYGRSDIVRDLRAEIEKLREEVDLYKKIVKKIVDE